MTHNAQGPTRGFTLRFPELDREILCLPGETIFQSARRGSVRIVGACGGRGTCGSCMVCIVTGKVEYGSAQKSTRQGETRQPKWFRACEARAQSDCTIEVAPRSLAAVVRTDVETRGEVAPLDCAPAVLTVDALVPEPSLADPSADSDRLLRALPQHLIVDLDVTAARALSGELRSHDGRVRVRLRSTELIDVVAPGSRTLGLAVDLGTTNAAAFLLDLEQGKRIAALAIENPQVAWGADVISRINYAIRTPGGGEELRATITVALNALAHDLCRAVNAKISDIADIAVCGNTAMHHLLLGLPVAQLARAPFVAAQREATDVKARDLGIVACPGAYVHLVANVGGFVGGDHVTALLATQHRWSTQRTSVVMDIGTNTEISLIHDGKILSASCPSGPALEGGHISCGMRAAEGAIERVKVVGESFKVEVIGDGDPVGLCGSGVLDALAALRRSGAANGRGRLSAGSAHVREIDGRRIAEIAPGVGLSQDDVRAVQLAKAAIRTGTTLLLRYAGIGESDIECFIIAGAFGAYLDVQSGIDIGLFPALPLERFTQVGNAAGDGVQRVLASTRERQRARDLALRCQYIELSTLHEFQRTFLGHIDLDLNVSRRSST